VSKGSRYRPTETGTEVVVAIAGRVAATVRRPAGPRVVVPIAATKDAVRAWGRRTCRVSRHIILVRLLIPVPGPFPNIATHVVQAPAVRLFLTDRMSCAIRISTVPGNLFQVVIQGAVRMGNRTIIPIARIKSSVFTTRTNRILPLRLCRQTVTLAVLGFRYSVQGNRAAICPR